VAVAQFFIWLTAPRYLWPIGWILVPSYFPNAFEHDIGENKRQNAIQQPTQQTK
jgi:hypothetical protein